MGRFFTELRRRKVIQVAAVYAVVAWLLIQIAVAIEVPLSMPPWIDTVVIVLLGIGFPVAIVFAWAFEMTPEKEPEATPSEQPPDQPIEDDKTAGAMTLDPKGIAVLPFENLSPDPDNAYFAAGIHEEILNQLTKIHALNVIARTSVLQYQETRETVPAIASALGVGTVMEGSVRYDGNRVRVTAQLIDGSSNVHLWSETYDRNLEDIFAIQSDIAERISAALKAELTSEEKASIERVPTENLEAYNLFLMARHRQQLKSNQGNPDDPEDYVELGIHDLERAISLDPGFAAGQAELAFYYEQKLLGFTGEKEKWNNLAFGAATRALDIDPTLARGHDILARLALHRLDWAESEAHYLRALDLNPEARTIESYAGTLLYLGRIDEALVMFERARLRDPTVAMDRRADAYFLANRYEKALEVNEESLRLGLSVRIYYARKARILLALGQKEAAFTTAQAAMDAEGAMGAKLADVLYVMIRTGHADIARDFTDQVDNAVPGGRLEWSGGRFWSALASGDVDAAFASMYEVIEQQPLSDFYLLEPAFDPLRNDPRFTKALGMMNLPMPESIPALTPN